LFFGANFGYNITAPMQIAKILVADPISERGVELLRRNPAFQVDVNAGLKKTSFFESSATTTRSSSAARPR